jgi:hypothetical protein
VTSAFGTSAWGITMTWQDPQGQSGREGQDPYGQNPYAHDPYWQHTHPQDPYARGPYAQDPYARYSYGGYGPPGDVPPGNIGLAVAALVANIISAILCCAGVGWIPGVITAAVALSRIRTDPESGRRLAIVSWVCFAADVVLAVAGFVLIGLLSGGHDSTSTVP